MRFASPGSRCGGYNFPAHVRDRGTAISIRFAVTGDSHARLVG